MAEIRDDMAAFGPRFSVVPDADGRYRVTSLEAGRRDTAARAARMANLAPRVIEAAAALLATLYPGWSDEEIASCAEDGGAPFFALRAAVRFARDGEAVAAGDGA